VIELRGVMTAITPLHLGTGKKTGTFFKTLDYVPGRTLRGMLGYYLYTNNKELFDKLAVSEDSDMSKTNIFLKNAHPLCYDKFTVASPVAFHWCKGCKSLMGYKVKECSNSECLQEGKKISGFITEDSFRIGRLEEVNLEKQIETKCPITRKGHTSPGADFELSPYHIESIASKAKFGFKAVVKDEFVDDVKMSLKDSGIFSGLGGFRSRGYGTIAFTGIKETPVTELIEKRVSEIEEIKETLLVTNSPLILRKGNFSFIGFGAVAEENLFSESIKKTLAQRGFSGSVAIRYTDGNPKQRISEGTARGWSLKDGNKASEVIPCTGAGSCAEIIYDRPEALAALEVYGIGEMTNSGYGDVYFTGGRV
jgi:Uncharacterized protein predicted to be involved in DNA repair (RAMP superfamily)